MESGIPDGKEMIVFLLLSFKPILWYLLEIEFRSSYSDKKLPWFSELFSPLYQIHYSLFRTFFKTSFHLKPRVAFNIER